LLAALVPQPVLADGLVRDGLGPISTGRGGTNIAFSDNAAIISDNPAGMMNVYGTGLAEIGLDTVFTDLDYTDPENPGVNGRFRPFPIPELGFFRKTADGNFAYGLGVFAPAGFGAEYGITNPDFGPSQTYKSIGLLGKVLPGAAVKLTDQLSVGGTFGLGVSIIETEGPFYWQTGLLAGARAQLDLQTLGFAPTGSIGAQYRLTRSTTLGVCYISESSFDLEGSANVQLVGYTPQPIPIRFDAELDITWPQSVGVGIKHELSGTSRVSCDVIWYDWSGAFDQIGMKLTNASNPLVRLLLPELRDAIPMNWHDTISLRLGYEWQTNPCSVWRLGYVYHESPVPSDTLMPYTDGVLEHCFAIGASRAYCGCTLNLAYQYSFSPKRHVGDSALAGDDFSNSTYQAQAHWASLSIVKPF
jgi:long-chain fatty acid transport protein